jgi:tetratricopeptide (TPR) repeat protein
MGQLLDGAWLLMQQQRFEQSEPKIREHLREFPDDVSGQVCLGLCLCDLGRYPEGIAAAHAALALEPDNAYAHWLLGAVNLRTQQMDQAETYFLKTIALDPEQPSFYASLGELYWQRGRQQKGTADRGDSWQRGIAAVETGLAINPEHPSCLEYLVRNLVATGEPDAIAEAIAVAAEFVAIAPEHAAAYEVYGQALLCEQQVRTQCKRPTRPDVERILPILQESLRLDPQQLAPKQYAYILLTSSYRRWNNGWSRLFAVALWPLLVVTFCLYQSGGSLYPIGICLGLCGIGLACLWDLTYPDWKIRRHPHYREFIAPNDTSTVFKVLWGLIAATIVLGLAWSWLPGWLIGGLRLLFQIGLGLLGFVLFIRCRRFFFWWTKDPQDYDNVLRCLWGLGVVGFVIGLTSTPGWLTGGLLLLFRIGLFLLGSFLLLMAHPCFFGVKPDKPE